MHLPISILKFNVFFLGLILISFNYSPFTFGHSRIHFISIFPVFFILQVSKSPFLSLFRIVGNCWFPSIIVYSLSASLGFGLFRINFIRVFPVFFYIASFQEPFFKSIPHSGHLCSTRGALGPPIFPVRSHASVEHVLRPACSLIYYFYFDFYFFYFLTWFIAKSMRFPIFILKPNALVLDPPYGKEMKQN